MKKLFTLTAIILIVYGAYAFIKRPRVWKPKEVPTAFWAWQSKAPLTEDARRAIEKTRARSLFLRAGQIDYEDGKPNRIRSVKGVFPTGIDLHLVYNCTSSLLRSFDSVDVESIVSAVSESYQEDLMRAELDGARVVGLQLDIDVPTRLLPKYELTLRRMRELLPKEKALSITGLPTWMDSREIVGVLGAVDFWIPQCYGAVVPQRLDMTMPISSPQAVARDIARASEFGRPFYAGLAAYGYAIHYSTNGELLELRGDIDPALIARNGALEFVMRRAFEKPQPASKDQFIASEWKYIYKARQDVVIDGLIMRSGEWVMLDMPTAESLRLSARAVRENAGNRLLGICVFRLPAESDPTTLTIEEVARALSDAPSVNAVDIRTDIQSASSGESKLTLSITNTGSTRAILEDGSFAVDLRIPAGALQAVRLEGFASYSTHCALSDLLFNEGDEWLESCSARRANVVRLKSGIWKPGATLKATIDLTADAPSTIAATIEVKNDRLESWNEKFNIEVGKDQQIIWPRKGAEQ